MLAIRFLYPITPAAIHVLSDDFPDNRQGSPGSFPGRQGRVCNIAHKFCRIMIDRLLRPLLAVGNGNIDRIGMVHGSWPFAYDVEYPPETVRVCLFEENFADPIAGPHPSAGDQDVL